MAEISAFRGLRYDLGHVGALQEVVAPRCHPARATEVDALYKRHPANVIRLLWNRDELGDEPQAKFERASRFLRNWQREGILQHEPDPAIYVYQRNYELDGRTFSRMAFICLLHMEPLGNGLIRAAKQPKPDSIRECLVRHCQANVAPVECVYSDPELTVQGYLDEAIAGVTPISARLNSVEHRIWPVTDIHTINQIASTMAPRDLVVVDGQSEYLASWNCRTETKTGESAMASHRVMIVCGAAEDPGFALPPQIMLFPGNAPLDSRQISADLAPGFEIHDVGSGSEQVRDICDELEIEEDTRSVALYCPADQHWLLARRKPDVGADVNDATVGPALGMTILEDIVRSTLGSLGDSAVSCSPDQFAHQLDKSEAAPVALAAMTLPPNPRHLLSLNCDVASIAEFVELTWPPALSGLVLYSF